MSSDADRQLGKRTVRDRVSVLSHLHDLRRGLQVALELMGFAKGPVEDRYVPTADNIRHQLIETLSECETFPADEQVCALLDVAATSYPTAHMFVTDILTPTGLAYFTAPVADPAPLPEAGVNYPIRAMSWSLAILDEGGDDRDEHERAARIRAQGRFAVTITVYTDTHNIPNPDNVPPSRMPTMYPITSVLWEVDAADGGIVWEGTAAEEAQLYRSPYVRILMAYWAIMRQRLTQSVETVVKPHPRDIANATRGRRRTINSEMHVIRLRPRTRRYQYTERSGHNRPDWQVQWWVRPHWRRQIDPRTGETKPALLIMSYMKGPDDKPVIGQDRIYYLPPPPEDKD